MRQRMMVVLGIGLVLTLALGVTESQGEWRMRIHNGAPVEEHAVAEIDSLTFYDAGVPGFVAVPHWFFTMGDGEAYCGENQHEVTLTRLFHLGQHEVTNQGYLEAVQWAYDHGYVTATTTSVLDNLDGSTQELLNLDAEGCEIAFSGGVFTVRDAGYGINPDHPVKDVTWYGAAAYCDWLSLQAGLPRAYDHSTWQCNGGDPYGAQGYRLPTDAEWEFAAQYDDERIYPWGDEAPDCDRANFYDDDYYCVGWTSPVGSYPDAPASWGLSDMAGNVWEWCNDWHQCDLGTNPVTDPPGPASGEYRVLRGGAWVMDGAEYLRCASRVNCSPDVGVSTVGFRAAMTVSSSDTEDPTEGSARISKSGLLQNRPNPFTPVTKIGFELAQAGRVELAIYGVDGRLIRTLINEERLAGSHVVTWDGCDAEGKKLAGGVYFYKLAGPGIEESRRMILLP